MSTTVSVRGPTKTPAPREMQIHRMFESGMSCAEISEALGLSRPVVSVAASRARRKLGLPKLIAARRLDEPIQASVRISREIVAGIRCGAAIGSGVCSLLKRCWTHEPMTEAEWRAEQNAGTAAGWHL